MGLGSYGKTSTVLTGMAQPDWLEDGDEELERSGHPDSGDGPKAERDPPATCAIWWRATTSAYGLSIRSHTVTVPQ